MFEERVEPPPVNVEPALLSTPTTSAPSPNQSSPDIFHVFRVYDKPSTSTPTDGQAPFNIDIPHAYPPTHPPSHPFKNDSIFELVKTSVLSPSSKTTSGMDEIASLISSGRVKAEELSRFNAATELRRLDEFAARSLIAGGPWKTGSVRIRMPCMRSNKPPFTTEGEAPEFEVPGIQYRSLVNIITSKIKDPSTSGSFVHRPFTEWWHPPGSSKPIRIYGEAYSSDIAIKLSEGVKGVPPLAEHPDMESVVVLLMLGSDATHLASFGTASLWPLYIFFGNMSKYDSSKPSEFPACHLAYLPKVGHIRLAMPSTDPLAISL